MHHFILSVMDGMVHKRIVFLRTQNPLVFNLAFGDVEPDGDKLNDTVVTDNGDRNKVLATVSEIVSIYTKRYPERWIFIKGSTKSRTRLYRMVIASNFKELSKTFDLFGITETDTVVPFTNEPLFAALLIKRRN
jgi:hypothetical protein